ncbi:MAG: hypothetical protein AB7F76_12725 [Parvibaculaceae bacterium]
MTLPENTCIAGQKTVADWRAMKGRLVDCADPTIWKAAFEDFFKARINSRYFEPIRAIEKMGQKVGAGFAIVTLHCSLIEFLAATLAGKTYRYSRNEKPPLGPFEYSDSGNMFITFLENCEPFSAMFSAQGMARDFYSDVRCGLLHEARTKGLWRIRVCESAALAIDATEKIIYRNKMQAAFDQFVMWYRGKLLSDVEFQKAFIRKFDGLCSE